jgi:hypothetical protein
MRAFVLILTLLCLAAPQAIAQDDGHGGNGQRNENATGQGNGQGNGNGQANGNGSDKGPGNGNGGGTKGDGNGPDRNSGNGNSQGKTDRGGKGNDGNSGNGPGGDDTGTGTDMSGSTDASGTIHFSQDYARDVVNRGKAVSLGSLMPELQARSEGSVIDAELLNVRGILVYSIKVLRTDGRVTQEYYYAQSGRFIGSEP